MAKKDETSDKIATVDKENTELAVNLPSALTAVNSNDIAELVAENLGAGATLNLTDLKRIKIPTGGMTMFEIQDPLTGEKTYEPAIYGVVIGHKIGKAFWAKKYGEGGSTGSPPDCRSDDGVHGIGNPNPLGKENFQIAQDEFGWLCETCPNNEFGTANDGEGAGKAVKDLRFMFFFTGDALLPQVLIAPPTSLKPMKDFFLGLINKGLIFRKVITKFELVKQISRGGIEYAQLKPSVDTVLSDDEAMRAKKFADLFAPMIGTVVTTIMEDGSIQGVVGDEAKDGFA